LKKRNAVSATGLSALGYFMLIGLVLMAFNQAANIVGGNTRVNILKINTAL
jgi:hypothetical protein